MSRELISYVHIYHQENENAVKLIFLQINFLVSCCIFYDMRPVEDTIIKHLQTVDPILMNE